MLSAIGLTHKTAPLTLRERTFVGREAVPAALAAIRATPGIVEEVLLCTCNRTELYTVGSPEGAAAAFTAFAASRGIATDELAPTMMVLHDRQAVLHAIRVASGLESMIIGEPQILNQVRHAHAVARRHGAAGPVLDRLMQTAVAAGRRVRRTTGLARHAFSVPRAAAALVEREAGPLRGRRVVIVGAGEIAALSAKAFAARGARITAVCNRTPQAARLVAEQYRAAVLSLEALPRAVADADVVVVAITGENTILSAAALSGFAPRLPQRFFIDLSVPRAVAADVTAWPGAEVRTLDDLPGAPVAQPLPTDLAAADSIADAAAAAFLSWQASRAAAPLIAALNGRAARIAEHEIRRAGIRLAELDEDQHDAVRGVVLAAMAKLLHAPMVRLRESAAEGTALLQAAEELFGLNPARHDGDRQ